MFKKSKIFENLGNNVQNLKKILKKGRWLHVIIARNKLLEKALYVGKLLDQKARVNFKPYDVTN